MLSLATFWRVLFIKDFVEEAESVDVYALFFWYIWTLYSVICCFVLHYYSCPTFYTD